MQLLQVTFQQTRQNESQAYIFQAGIKMKICWYYKNLILKKNWCITLTVHSSSRNCYVFKNSTM